MTAYCTTLDRFGSRELRVIIYIYITLYCIYIYISVYRFLAACQMGCGDVGAMTRDLLRSCHPTIFVISPAELPRGTDLKLGRCCSDLCSFTGPKSASSSQTKDMALEQKGANQLRCGPASWASTNTESRRDVFHCCRCMFSLYRHRA